MGRLSTGIALGAALVVAGLICFQRSENRALRAALVADEERGAAAQRETTEQMPTRGAAAAIAGEPGARASMSQAPAPSPSLGESKRVSVFWHRSLLDSSHAPLFRRLRLPAEQLAELQQLLAARGSEVDDAARLGATMGVELTRDVMDEIRAHRNETLYAEVQERLGAATAASLVAYESTLHTRRVLAPLVDSLRYSAAKLSDAQLDQLCALGAKHGFLQTNSSGYWRQGFISDALLQEAARVLDAEQLRRFSDLQRAWAAKARATAMEREAAKAGLLELAPDSAREYAPRKGGG